MHSTVRSALRRAKQTALGGARRAGLFTVVKNSAWRQRRLLVLCYHGIALEDEHLWNGSLYMSPEVLRQRFGLLRAGGYQVLPLGEAIERLYARDLPPRAVALTFDDGYYDFYAAAWPLLQEFEYPATVYLATFRCDRNLPVFNLAVPLLLWRRRGGVYDAHAIGLGQLDLRTPGSRAEAWARIQQLAGTSGPERKHEIAQGVSDAIGGDYGAITLGRLLTIMRPADVTRLAAEGLDVQLHTHQHRTPRDREAFDEEIARNRQRIVELTGRTPQHFCYPSGLYEPEFLPWLADAGVVSATTCDPGMASRSSDSLLLPRLVDHEGLSPLEFEAWLTGTATVAARKAASYRKRPSLHTSARQFRKPLTDL
jgi:peptidoglycan/xylan/chitin deacetylase (PgdA/CDA1 family)